MSSTPWRGASAKEHPRLTIHLPSISFVTMDTSVFSPERLSRALLVSHERWSREQQLPSRQRSSLAPTPAWQAKGSSPSRAYLFPWERSSGVWPYEKNGVKLIVLGLGRPFLSTVVNAGLITLVSPSETGLARSMLMSRLVGRGEMIEAFKNGSGV